MSDKRHPPTELPEPELVRADRDPTREELTQTVSALTAKLDVRARTEDKLHQTADTAREKATEVRAAAQENAMRVAEVARLRPVLAAVAALLAALVAWFILRDRLNR